MTKPDETPGEKRGAGPLFLRVLQPKTTRPLILGASARALERAAIATGAAPAHEDHSLSSLAGIRQRIVALGGYVTFAATPGRGSVIEATLPLEAIAG